ncbi:MAG: hypothetical protein EOP48_21840, partial [Sphingobacteriales bacterium]
MKTKMLFILLISALGSFAQTNVYTFNNGVLYTEGEMKNFIDTFERKTPMTYQITPIIYHKVVGTDIVVNYIVFSSVNLEGHPRRPVKIEFQQDSLFLMLNKQLPEFELTDLDGKAISSMSLRG